jgi:signal transduction histidine kinase
MLEVWSRGPEVIGQRLADVTEPAFARLFDEVLRSGAPRIGREGTFPLPGGSGEAAPARFFNYELGPLVDEAGTVSGVLACAFEVTDQVKARDEAEAANRAKDEFLATMSHELRTPLQSIHGWASILIHGSADAAKREHGLEVIQRNARAQERLINDLLEMSRIVSGKLKLVLSSAPLWDVVHAAVDVVRPAADAKEVRLLIDVDPDLPRLVVDPARLQQVVWNLLTNSVKFTPRGGQITVTGDRSDRTSASGCGTPAPGFLRTNCPSSSSASGSSMHPPRARMEASVWGWPSCATSSRRTGERWRRPARA